MVVEGLDLPVAVGGTSEGIVSFRGCFFGKACLKNHLELMAFIGQNGSMRQVHTLGRPTTGNEPVEMLQMVVATVSCAVAGARGGGGIVLAATTGGDCDDASHAGVKP